MMPKTYTYTFKGKVCSQQVNFGKIYLFPSSEKQTFCHYLKTRMHAHTERHTHKTLFIITACL